MKYEQQVTIVLTKDEAVSLSVALSEYLRYTQEAMEKNPSYRGEKPHPRSCAGKAKALKDDLRQIALGWERPENGLATYKMVPVKTQEAA